MKGLVHTSEGWEFQSDKRRYSLYEGTCIQPTSPTLTSDMLFIVDNLDLDREVHFVGYLWGATFISDSNERNEWEKYIAEIIESYEAKQHMPNGIERLKHAKEIVEAYLVTNEEIIREMDEDGIEKVEEIKKDIDYLTTLIEKAKEMQR